uniref:Uncharacterized protein n=1 Tax=Kalanchoe fedtschenkoi TaxID=63787 RepID=A0A7N0TY08_KALFE
MMGLGRHEPGQLGELVGLDVKKLDVAKLRADSSGRHSHRCLVHRSWRVRVQAWWSDPDGLDGCVLASRRRLWEGGFVDTPPTVVAFSVEVESRLVRPTRPPPALNESDSLGPVASRENVDVSVHVFTFNFMAPASSFAVRGHGRPETGRRHGRTEISVIVRSQPPSQPGRQIGEVNSRTLLAGVGVSGRVDDRVFDDAGFGQQLPTTFFDPIENEPPLDALQTSFTSVIIKNCVHVDAGRTVGLGNVSKVNGRGDIMGAFIFKVAVEVE